MMKYLGLLIALTFTSCYAMQQRTMRTQVARFEHVIEWSDRSKTTMYLESGYDHDDGLGHDVAIARHETKGMKDILYRNFIASEGATGGAILLIASLIGLVHSEPTKSRKLWANTTDTCHLHDNYNFARADHALKVASLCGVAAGSILCCRQCLKATKETCDLCREHAE